MAQITFVVEAVPCSFCCVGVNRVGLAPLDKLLGETAVGIFLPECFVDDVAIDVAGVWAAAGFEVMRYAAGSCEGSPAERADYRRSAV